ncbi:hypothetical protein ACLOJK_018200 [Asimina triloba]
MARVLVNHHSTGLLLHTQVPSMIDDEAPIPNATTRGEGFSFAMVVTHHSTGLLLHTQVPSMIDQHY